MENKEYKTNSEQQTMAEFSESTDLTAQIFALEKQTSGSNEKKKRGKLRSKGKKVLIGITISLAILLTFALASCILIAEPWLKPQQDSYVLPEVRSLKNVSLMVGEEYEIQVECSENEKIFDIKSSDERIISIDQNKATALAEFFSIDVLITTSEIEVAQRELKQFDLFGMDFSKPYNAIRDFIRELLGIEARYVPRTELRILNIYSLNFTVEGFDNDDKLVLSSPSADGIGLSVNPDTYVQRSTGVIYVGESSNAIDFGLKSGESVENVLSNNKDVSRVFLGSGGGYRIKGISSGETEITAKIGFWKKVDDETYIAFQNQDNGVVRETDSEKEIFAATRCVIFKIKIEDVPAPPEAVTDGGGSSNGGSSGSGSSGSGSSGSGSSGSGSSGSGSSGGGSSGGGSSGSGSSGGGSSGSGSPSDSITGEYYQGEAKKVLDILNVARAEAGLGQLSWSGSVENAAKIRAEECSRSFSHTRPDGSSCFTALTISYSACGENIAAGYSGAQSVYNGWYNSPGHYENMFNGTYTQIGISCYYKPNGTGGYSYYWAMMLIR